MNKKMIFLLFGLMTLSILSVYAYQKYAQYIPTTDTAQFLPNLTVSEIQKIRQNSPITEVKVYKAERRVQLLHDEHIIRSYVMRLGFDPLGHKVQEGDGKTPEGRYTLDWRNPQSAFYKSLHISYPNERDKAKAAALEFLKLLPCFFALTCFKQCYLIFLLIVSVFLKANSQLQLRQYS